MILSRHYFVPKSYLNHFYMFHFNDFLPAQGHTNIHHMTKIKMTKFKLQSLNTLHFISAVKSRVSVQKCITITQKAAVMLVPLFLFMVNATVVRSYEA